MAGEGRVVFATHEGRDIGFIFGGRLGEIYRGQQFSLDDAGRGMSIGNVLQYEQIAWLCEEGAHRYDRGPLIGPPIVRPSGISLLRRSIAGTGESESAQSCSLQPEQRLG